MNKLKMIFTIFFIINLIPAAQAGKYFTCTADCEPAEPGFFLIGCTTFINNTLEYEEGSHVPLGSSNGYVYVVSRTDPGYDEMIVSEYWKKDVPLPSSRGEFERERISDYIRKYNRNFNNLPDTVLNLFGNEKLHIYVTNIDGTKSEYATITENGLILEGTNWLDQDSDGEHDIWQQNGIEATMAFYVKETTLNELAYSGNPIAAFEEAWGNDIKYEGLTFGTKIKTGLMGVGVELFSLFSDGTTGEDTTPQSIPVFDGTVSTELIKTTEKIRINLDAPSNKLEADFTGEDLQKVSLDTIEAVQSGVITVQKLRKKPDPVPPVVSHGGSKTYAYHNIYTHELDKSLIKLAVVKFRVDLAWVRENRINNDSLRLVRFNEGEWKVLETKILGEDEEFIYCEAISGGFSIFAIVGDTLGEDANATDQMTPEDDFAQTPSQPGFGAVQLLTGLVAMVYILRRGRR